MRVYEIMSRGAVSVTPESRADDAWQLMLTKGIRHLVVKEGNRVVGVLSETDAGGRLGAPVRANATVAELMNRRTMTIGSDATIRHAANLMRGRLLDSLLVMDEDRLIGIVTTTDMLKAIGGGIDRRETPARRAEHHRVPHRKAAAATGRW